jgi:hypothetical protein
MGAIIPAIARMRQAVRWWRTARCSDQLLALMNSPIFGAMIWRQRLPAKMP